MLSFQECRAELQHCWIAVRQDHLRQQWHQWQKFTSPATSLDHVFRISELINAEADADILNYAGKSGMRMLTIATTPVQTLRHRPGDSLQHFLHDLCSKHCGLLHTLCRQPRGGLCCVCKESNQTPTNGRPPRASPPRQKASVLLATFLHLRGSNSSPPKFFRVPPVGR